MYLKAALLALFFSYYMSPIYQHQPNQTPSYHNSQTTLKYTPTHPALLKYNLTSNTPWIKIISFCGKRRISINENKSFELIFRKHSRKSTAEVTAKTYPLPQHTHSFQIIRQFPRYHLWLTIILPKPHNTNQIQSKTQNHETQHTTQHKNTAHHTPQWSASSKYLSVLY